MLDLGKFGMSILQKAIFLKLFKQNTMYLLPLTHAIILGLKNPCRQLFPLSNFRLSCLLLCALFWLFPQNLYNGDTPSSISSTLPSYSLDDDHKIKSIKPQVVLSEPPDNLPSNNPWGISLLLTAGVLAIAFLAKYVNEVLSNQQKSDSKKAELPQNPNQLRKPIAKIISHIDTALGKVKDSDSGGTTDSLIAIESECIQILKYLEGQINPNSLNDSRMEKTKAHPDSVLKSNEMKNELIDSSSYQNNDLNEVESNNHDNLLIQSVMEQINLNKDNTDFNVEILCKKVGMSYSQLHRKVTLICGNTPNHLIRDARLQKAKELLLDHNINIADVAFLSGYNDPSYFSRIFAKENRMTPSEYREEIIRKTSSNGVAKLATSH